MTISIAQSLLLCYLLVSIAWNHMRIETHTHMNKMINMHITLYICHKTQAKIFLQKQQQLHNSKLVIPKIIF